MDVCVVLTSMRRARFHRLDEALVVCVSRPVVASDRGIAAERAPTRILHTEELQGYLAGSRAIHLE